MGSKRAPILWDVLTGASLLLVTVGIVSYNVTNNYKDVINKAFGLEGSKRVEVSDTSAIDTEYFKSDYKSKEDLKKADMEAAERLTEEGAVLLKNKDKALPLANDAKVTILGHSSTNMLVCGTGSADIDATGAPTLKEALEARTGVKVNPTVWNYYADLTAKGQYETNPKKGDNSIRTGDGTVSGSYTVNEVPWGTLTGQSGVSQSFNSYKDAAIVVVSRLGGEMYDIPDSTAHKGNSAESPTGNSLELSINEIELIKQAKANFDKVVVLINSTNAVECDFLTDKNNEYGVDAALWIGYTGLVGLYGVADLLVGNANPSGRLVDTYCNDNTTNPAMVNFYSEAWTNTAAWGKDMTTGGLDGNMYFNAYQEGIYVGYRYYETRYEDFVKARSGVGTYSYADDVAYPFGYGLSYTTFEYSNIEYKENENDITVSLTVKNTGNYAGKEVVEVYFQSEYTKDDITKGIEKAAIELCGFTKTGEIAPNKTEKVTIKVDKKEFRTYDAKGAKTYIMDAGQYYMSVGRNAHDALNNVLAKKGADSTKIVSANGDGKGDASLVYGWTVSETDTTTYSKSEVTGNAITNQCESAELSSYGGKDMTYLSRNNWTGTWPTRQKIELTQKMRDEMTGIKDYVAETDSNSKMPTMGASNGLTLISLKDKDYDDPAWEKLLDQVTYAEMCKLIGLGYHGTIALESVSKPTTKDENGPQGFSGKLTDLTGNALTMCAYTDENIMAATWNVELMEEIGEHIGEDGLACGYSGLYGPAMNTHRTAYSGRNFEYYSEDGFLGGKIAAAEVKGIQSKGVYVCVKHFALNDEETNCRSISTFANEQAIREIYLEPFEHAIVEGGALCVMNAFSRVGVVWSGAHKGLMTNILRGEWGMKGFAISDYTTTGFATTAHPRGTYDAFLGVMGGTDTFDSSGETSQARYLQRYDYSNDPVLVNRMREATHRILYTVVNSNAMNGYSDGTVVLEVMNWWQFAIIDEIIYSSIALAVFGTFAVLKNIAYFKSKKETEAA